MNQAKYRLTLLIAILGLGILSSCRQPTFINLTSKNISQNPSGIYTLQTEVDIQDRRIDPKTIKVSVVVGGERIPMVKDPVNSTLWSSDYKLPQGFDEATYYFQANYSTKLNSGALKPGEIKSDLQVFRLENRYVGNLASYRGPVGVEIAVQGRGLTKYDSISFGGEKAQTRYLSENELRFTIPALPAGVDYPVQLIGGPHGALDIGNFRIDQSPLGVVPSSLEIASGDSATLLFKIDYDAPSGGLPIEVRTNIPDSVVMPEAMIAEGDRTVNIPVQGGAPAEGKLIITAPGYDSLEVPVRVF
ncbi:hypothetical protein N8920_01950 [Opitutales bacterium]|nr:hypothetical protein [Opitutales bacterium]